MSKNKINEMIIEIKNDYDKSSEGKTKNEWFLDIIRRKIIDIYYNDLSEEEKIKKNQEIANELIAGLRAFKLNKEKIKNGENIITDMLEKEQKNDMDDFIDSAVNSIKSLLIR